MGSMLRTLRHGFLKEALDFVGVHRERLAQVNKNTHFSLISRKSEASTLKLFKRFIEIFIFAYERCYLGCGRLKIFGNKNKRNKSKQPFD